MEGAAASAPAAPHVYLQSKFQVGSSKSKINFSLSQKVFHSGDVPKEILESKRAVLKKKHANILGTEPHEWNQSTIADQKIQKDVVKDLKRQLLKVRAGLMDEKVVKPSKKMTDEMIAERQRYIVGITGQGPIGKLTGKWSLDATMDERGLARHCVQPDWPDWNQSAATHNKEDIANATTQFNKFEAKRTARSQSHAKLNKSAYINPTQSISNVNDRLRERKVECQDLKEQFKRELRVEFPQASEERLQAMAQRLLNEKLLADEKLSRFPVQHESFRPNLSLTTQDRRYKEYHHPGSWYFHEEEKLWGWSCCGNFSHDSRGCECKVINPDAWCTLGFERNPGKAAAGRL